MNKQPAPPPVTQLTRLGEIAAGIPQHGHLPTQQMFLILRSSIYQPHTEEKEKAMSGKQQEKLQAYWQKNVRLIRILIIIWAFVSLGMSVVFKPLVGNLVLPGFQIPISFWFAHQGAMIIFVILIFAYAYLMDKADSEYGVRE